MASNLGAKGQYAKLDITLIEIRPNSIGVESKAGGVVFIGRSLLAYLSDERVEKYDGPLPAEFRIELATWRARQGDI